MMMNSQYFIIKWSDKWYKQNQLKLILKLNSSQNQTSFYKYQNCVSDQNCCSCFFSDNETWWLFLYSSFENALTKISFSFKNKEYIKELWKIISDKNKLKTIDGLLIILQKASFVYHYRIKIKENEEGNFISCKLK